MRECVRACVCGRRGGVAILREHIKKSARGGSLDTEAPLNKNILIQAYKNYMKSGKEHYLMIMIIFCTGCL